MIRTGVFKGLIGWRHAETGEFWPLEPGTKPVECQVGLMWVPCYEEGGRKS